MVHTAEGSHATPLTFREPSDEPISPQPLNTPDEVDSSDMSGLSSTSRTSHDDASLRAKQANAILRLPPEVIERYIPPLRIHVTMEMNSSSNFSSECSS